jgi:hypothetical protein
MGLFEKKHSMRGRWVAAAAFVATVVVNGIAGGTTLLNGQNTAAISDKNDNLFAPAGYTFAIWGLIYVMLAVYVAYQLGWLGKLRRARLNSRTIDAITPYFTATSLLNIAWIFAWQYEVLWLSVLFIVGMLYSLERIEAVLKDKDYSVAERMLVKNAFSVYFGWITVATVANIATWLVSIKWDGLGLSDVFWTSVVLMVAAGIGVAGMARNSNCAYGAVFIWAFTGILVKHVSVPGWDGAYPLVIGVLWTLLVVLTTVFGYTLRKAV